MRIYRYVRIDMRTLEDVEPIYYEYDGPLVLCGGGGKGGGTESSAALNEIAKKLFKETTPLRQEFTGQLEELLKTGGIGAQIPLISKSVERTRQAGSKAMTGTQERLAQTELAGTPFGERITGEVAQQGELAVAGVPGQWYSQMLPMILGLITGQGQTVVSGLGSAAGAEATGQAAQMEMWSKLIPSTSIGLGK